MRQNADAFKYRLSSISLRSPNLLVFWSIDRSLLQHLFKEPPSATISRVPGTPLLSFEPRCHPPTTSIPFLLYQVQHTNVLDAHHIQLSDSQPLISSFRLYFGANSASSLETCHSNGLISCATHPGLFSASQLVAFTFLSVRPAALNSCTTAGGANVINTTVT